MQNVSTAHSDVAMCMNDCKPTINKLKPEAGWSLKCGYCLKQISTTAIMSWPGVKHLNS